MKQFATGADGDFILGDDGDLVTIEGIDEVAQNVATIIAIRQGEFDPDPNVGTSHDWLYQKGFDIDSFEQDLQEEVVAQCDEVSQVEIDSWEIIDRTLHLELTVTSVSEEPGEDNDVSTITSEVTLPDV